MRTLFVILFLFFPAGVAIAEDYCEGCGCKGGPGYRGPNGQCVAWKRLNKVCSSPPTTRCSAEGPALRAIQKLGIAGSVDRDSSRGPVASNQLKTLIEGVACSNTESLQTLRACQNNAYGCEVERQALIAARACFDLPVGTPVEIEASSRSFDWLRVRLDNGVPVWTERSLVLGAD
jgi:hypothetical protein